MAYADGKYEVEETKSGKYVEALSDIDYQFIDVALENISHRDQFYSECDDEFFDDDEFDGELDFSNR